MDPLYLRLCYEAKKTVYIIYLTLFHVIIYRLHSLVTYCKGYYNNLGDQLNIHMCMLLLYYSLLELHNFTTNFSPLPSVIWKLFPQVVTWALGGNGRAAYSADG